MNTKAECKHYKGKIWLNGEIGKSGNICADTGHEEMMVIAYVPVITEENIVNAVEAMGWESDRWLGEDFRYCYFEVRGRNGKLLAKFQCRFDAEEYAMNVARVHETDVMITKIDIE